MTASVSVLRTVKRGAAFAVAAAGTAAVAAMLLVSGAPRGAEAQVAPPSAAEAGTVSAVGVAQVQGGAASTGGSLSMSIQEHSRGSDVQAAVKTVQEKIARMRSALEGAGVPASAIHTQGFNVGPMYGYPGPYPMPMPMPVPPMKIDPTMPMREPADAMPGVAGGSSAGPAISVPPMPPPISGYSVNAQLMVDTTSLEQLATAMRIAIEQGATGVNSFNKGVPAGPPPEGAPLATAIGQATEQAKAMAQASASAAGVTLGDLHSVTVLSPTPSYGGPMPTAYWQVQVRVAYRIR